MLRVFLVLLSFASPALSEEVVAGLSQTNVAITANFDGSEILIFGAVKRFERAPVELGPLEVIVAIAGPSKSVTVRRKDRRYGIWINTDAVEVDHAPTFYAVATSGPLSQILSSVDDLRYKVSIPRAIRSVGAPMTVSNSANFSNAVIRIRTDSGLYQVLENSVTVTDETLFNTSIDLPANLTEGNYTARIFLTRGGSVQDVYSTEIFVQKVGLERWIYVLAHEQPLLYGILSLVIAISAGWMASAVFRYIRS